MKLIPYIHLMDRHLCNIRFGLGTDHLSRKIQQAILNTRIKGLGKDRTTAIFPKLVFSIKKGTNFSPQDPNFTLNN